jgi:UDP-N-acetyl-D-galactosamine dehydrogenase
VGGHCIGVDPYYFVYEAEKLGYHSQIILSGRKVNDGMGAFVADAAIKTMVLAGQLVRDAKVVVLGLTFKENCPDIRNSKVEDIISRLREYGVQPTVVDPYADENEAKREYGLDLVAMDTVKNADCIIFAVAHEKFKALCLSELDAMYRACDNSEKVLIDVKGLFDKNVIVRKGYRYWRL